MRSGRLGRARSCAAGAIAAVVVVTIWGTTTAPAVHEDIDPFWNDVTSRHLASIVFGLGHWAFVAGALGWHHLIERRRRPRAPARLAFDGRLTLGVWLAGAVMLSALAPVSAVNAVDEATHTFCDSPSAAAANGVIALALTGILAVLGVFAVTRLAERRDEMRLAWRALDRQGREGA